MKQHKFTLDCGDIGTVGVSAEWELDWHVLGLEFASVRLGRIVAVGWPSPEIDLEVSGLVTDATKILMADEIMEQVRKACIQSQFGSSIDFADVLPFLDDLEEAA